ncbi:hypothetical protein KY285_010969 [Solanum tuberosum]|nr:hypothetical protein KY289_011541 [Solanum tuberosum]KAH0735262.1 hypothetical protein KY285_010969 [Solanum tuberosum]
MEKILSSIENSNNIIKLDPLDGSNFTRWNDKMNISLTALKIFYVLNSLLVALPESTPDDTNEVKIERKKCEEDELLCREESERKRMNKEQVHFSSQSFRHNNFDTPKVSKLRGKITTADHLCDRLNQSHPRGSNSGTNLEVSQLVHLPST